MKRREEKRREERRGEERRVAQVKTPTPHLGEFRPSNWCQRAVAKSFAQEAFRDHLGEIVSPKVPSKTTWAKLLPKSFAQNCPSQAQFTILRVPTLMLLLKPLSRSRSVAGAHIQSFTFIALAGVTPENLRTCWTPWNVFQDGSNETM